MSDDTDDHSFRLEALEVRIAHQDRMLGDLNEVITAQWRKIDALERRLAKMLEEYQNMTPPREAPEPPPPHY